MATITTSTHKILDSAGNLANGVIYFRQTTRFVTSTALVTTAQGQVTVKNGEFARPLVIPTTPASEFVQIVEVFGPNPSTRESVTWWTHVGALSTYEYTDLPVDVAPSSGVSPTVLDDLADVDTTTVAPTNGQALVWDSTAGQWEPGTVSGGGGGFSFADPNADRIGFWDDSAGAFVALTHSAPLTISGTTLSISAASTSATGISELTTGAEAVTGTDTTRAMTADAHRDTWGLYYGINAQTGTTYAPVLEDQGKLVTLSNAAAITVTLPSNATTAFPIGTQISFVVLAAGMATFVAGSGATVNGTPSLVTRAQYSAASAIKVSTDGWILVGDMA